MPSFFEGLKAEDLPDGRGWAVETVQLSTHNGTHLDAPYHFHPTMNRGQRSWTDDDGAAGMVPATYREAGFPPFARRLRRHRQRCRSRACRRISHTLSPLEIVVVNTSAGARYGQQDYVNSGCGMGYEATMYLLERGVRLAGIDGWCWDAPFSLHREEIRGDRRCQPDLGGLTQGRAPHRLLPYREAAQSRNAAVGEGFYDFVLSSQGRACIGGLDPRSCHRREMSRKIGGSIAGGAMDDVASNAHNS